ncbi:MAG TPA: hypothetical protein VIG74_00525 [Alphaproteobacteria bacterium]
MKQAEQQAWVVFSGKADMPWLRCLRPGFKHCFVLLRDGTRWISVDPMLNRMEVLLQHVPSDFDMPDWLKERGNIIVPAAIDRSKTRPAPWRPFTCVEAVKRVLGIHQGWIFTPWQLYRHLKKEAVNHG